MTEGRSPPQIALQSERIQSIMKYPKNENVSPKNQIMMKLRANASPLQSPVSRHITSFEEYDFVR